jgi:hypothetical protein
MGLVGRRGNKARGQHGIVGGHTRKEGEGSRGTPNM